MIDREKVIAALKECANKTGHCSKCPYRTVEYCEYAAMADAAVLLAEQEPVKPTVDTRDGWCWYRCGKCGNLLASGVGERAVRSFGASKYPVYCETCGKKVDWNA